MFDEKTQKLLRSYVYMLLDPKNDQPFYVGKGGANRVFEHIKCAVNEKDITNPKYDEIRRIQAQGYEVKHLIVRHGLDEEVAFEIECALIDTFKFIPQFQKFAKGNKQGGVKSTEKGLMTTDEIIRLYNAKPLPKITKDCVIININKKYKRGASEDSIYQATKETWRINKKRTDKIRFVLSEYKGIVVEVFEVEKWYQKEKRYKKGTKKEGKTYLGFGFEGKVAEDKTRNRYINKKIDKEGNRYPLLYAETWNKLQEKQLK